MRWVDAVKKARNKLGIKGFQPVRKGTKLYKLAQLAKQYSIARSRPTLLLAPVLYICAAATSIV